MFAELKDPVRSKIDRYGLSQEIDAHHFFPTVGAAVEAFRVKTGSDWAEGPLPGSDVIREQGDGHGESPGV